MQNPSQRLPLFPTSVIGSLPRPAWLLDVMQDYLAGRITPAWEVYTSYAWTPVARIDVGAPGSKRPGGRCGQRFADA